MSVLSFSKFPRRDGDKIETIGSDARETFGKMGFYGRYSFGGGGGSAGPRVGEKRALRDYDVTASELRGVRKSHNGWNGTLLYNCEDLQLIQDQKRARVAANVAAEKQKQANKAKVRLCPSNLWETGLLHPLTHAFSQEIEDNLLKKHGSAESVAAFKASQAIKEAEAASKAKMMSLRMGLSLVDLSSGYKLPADWREESLNKTNAKKVSRSNLPVVVSRDRDRCCRRSCSFFHRCASPICLVLSCAFILAGQAAEARVCLESSDESPSLCHERLPL